MGGREEHNAGPSWKTYLVKGTNSVLTGPEFRRSQIRDFLRARRRELVPGNLGLPNRRRWGAPGLRLQDVAELAGLSMSRYTSIELGTATNISPRTIQSIAGALQLDELQTEYLYRLTGTPQPAGPSPESVPVNSSLRRLVERHEDGPALLLDRHFDILASNALARTLSLAGDEGGFGCNLVWRVFMVPRCRALSEPWQLMHESHLVGTLRRLFAEHSADTYIEKLILALQNESPMFAELWDAQTVASSRSRRIDFVLPTGEAIAVENVVLEDTEGLRACFFVPLDAASSRSLARLQAAASP